MKKENIKRIFDIAYYQLENHPIEEALSTKRNGTWQKLSTQQYIEEANRLSRGLLKLGVKPNDKIGVITTSNISEWNILDIAVLQIGAQNVPIYPTNTIDAYRYILKHSEVQYVFVSDEEVLTKVKAGREGSDIKEIYGFVDIPGCKNWEEVLKLGDDKSLQTEVDRLKSAVTEDDLATLIYTSGTTGTPKGVMLTHKNIVSNVLDSSTRVPFETGTQTALSLLPVCHVFERMLIYLYQYFSISVYYAESIDKVGDNLKEVKPTFLTVVPRVLEKAFASFYKKGNEMKGLKRQLFHWAVNLSKRYNPFGENSAWYMFQLNIARKLVLSKWKEGMGGRIELLVSGSSALDAELARIYCAAEMTTIEGYGLTETSPVISVNTTKPELFKLGSVGKPIPHVEVKIAEDGEILVKGPNVMKGYFKDEEKTKEAFTEDGYFYTGDIGNLDENGFLSITDRKKQLFKTSGGKYIAPQRIEMELLKSPFIEHVIVVGDGKKMPAALIQPDFAHVKSWMKHKEHELKDDSMKGICQNQIVIDRIQQDVDEVNSELGNWEKVKTFRLTPKVWSIEGEELTPTLKVKRRNVIRNFQELFDSIYKE